MLAEHSQEQQMRFSGQSIQLKIADDEFSEIVSSMLNKGGPTNEKSEEEDKVQDPLQKQSVKKMKIVDVTNMKENTKKNTDQTNQLFLKRTDF